MSLEVLALAFFVLSEFSKLKPVSFWGVLALALFIAGMLPLGCRSLARLTDLRYRFSITQATLCGLASVLTFVGVLAWFGVDYLSPAVQAVILDWQTGFPQDNAWNDETFRLKYWGVHELRDANGNPLENFDDHPPPEQGGHRIPIGHAESRQLCGNIDAVRVAEYFKRNHPFLSWLLIVKGDTFPNILKEDIDAYFKQNPGVDYPASKAVELAGRLLRTSLEQQLPGIIFKVRLMLVAILALLWLPLLAWATMKAWKNLEPIS